MHAKRCTRRSPASPPRSGWDPAQEIQLIDSKGNVIGTPSAPTSTRNGFDLCAWATTCS